MFAAEGYNHIGDPTWDRGEGGRVILPLECYSPSPGNTCGTGAFGVADPKTLAWRYYVKLDPAEIPKAMWAEASPDGKLIWTSSGNDLLAYRASDVTAANAAPGHAPIHSVRRLAGRGAAVGHHRGGLRGRPAAAGGRGRAATRSGPWTRRPEGAGSSSRPRCAARPRASTTIRTLGGDLHWLLSPIDDCQLTYPPSSALLHLVRGRASRG